MTASTQAWLFVRGKESIRVIKLPLARTLLVCGPGPTERSHRFEDDQSLESFRQSHEQQLVGDGWVLHFTSERRTEPRDDETTIRLRGDGAG